MPAGNLAPSGLRMNCTLGDVSSVSDAERLRVPTVELSLRAAREQIPRVAAR